MGLWFILKSEGTVFYSEKDLALGEDKFKNFKIDRSITITSSEQDLHFKQLIKTLHLMKFKYASKYEHKSYGSIRLPSGKMSSRTGDNVLYQDFKDELLEEAKKSILEREKVNNKELDKILIKILFLTKMRQ